MSTRRKKKNNKKLSSAQKTTIAIVILAFLTVIIAVLCSIFLKPEQLTKNRLDNLARDYYENYLYADISKSSNKKTPAEVLKTYETVGLSVVHLRQLLYYKKDDTNLANEIKEVCDENKTIVKYYPEEPFEKNSYRFEYTYSCDFE